MVSDDLGRQLHDKATRGIELSTVEQAQLEAWYAAHDQAEHHLITNTNTLQRLAPLQAQIEAGILQLQSVTQHIQELTAQNEAVREEIAHLQSQLVHRATRQTV